MILQFRETFDGLFGKRNTKIENIYVFSVLQPILYIQPNFGNLNEIIPSLDIDMVINSISNIYAQQHNIDANKHINILFRRLL